jgi:hypothetical protein
MQKEKDNRGGQRPGSGRKAIHQDAIQLSVYIPRAIVEALDKEADRLGVSRGRAITDLLAKSLNVPIGLYLHQGSPKMNDNKRQSDHPMHYFVCATNRCGNDRTLEEAMHEHNCAAMWEWEDGIGTVSYLAHMEEVQKGDLIFMFARGKVGILGVGKATGVRQGPFPPGHARRIRSGWEADEYQVPVEWLHWVVDADACPFRFRGTFLNVSGPTWDKQRQAVIQHYQRLGLDLDA